MKTAVHADSSHDSVLTDKAVRHKNIDIARSVALFSVVVYHIWVLTGSAEISNPVLSAFIWLGGEIGVTLFFVLSGYGIFCSLDRRQKKGPVRFLPFMKRRLIRILPEYDLSLFVLVFFSPQATCLSAAGWKHVFLHLVFLHNIDSVTASSINGILWTMAVIVQFYLIAIPMYHLLRKVKYLFPVLFIAITIGFKFFCFHCFGTADAFWESRQLLPSVADNFALGMFTAWLLQQRMPELALRRWFRLVMLALSLVLLYLVCRFGLDHSIYSDTLCGYVWHTLLALPICLGLFFYAEGELTRNHILKRGMLWLSKYEYGIYIVHLVLIVNLLEHSTIINRLAAIPAFKYPCFLILSVFSGWVLSSCADGIRSHLRLDSRPR